MMSVRKSRAQEKKWGGVPSEKLASAMERDSRANRSSHLLPPQGARVERGDGDEFCVRMHRDREITELLMTAAQVRELDPADVDLHWNTASGEIRVQPATGDAKEYFAEIPGVGEEIGRPLMLFLMERPGQLFNLWELRTDRDLAHMLNTGALAARITKIRRALGEDGQTHYFINTAKRPYRVGWSKQRSWRLIERVTQQAEAVSGARESA